MLQKSGVRLTERKGTGRGCALRSLIKAQLPISSSGEDSVKIPLNVLLKQGEFYKEYQIRS